MAAITVTIINGNSDPTFVGTKQLTLADLAVISPTGITTPQTPYAEWVADTTAQLDGSVQIPAWKRSGTQYFILPGSSKVVFDVESVDEALFYRDMIGKFANVTITVATDPVTDYVLVLKKLELTDNTATDIIDATNTTAGASYACVSSDATVATVAASTGKVTAVANGTATITVTATWTEGEGEDAVTITDVKTSKVTVSGL